MDDPSVYAGWYDDGLLTQGEFFYSLACCLPEVSVDTVIAMVPINERTDFVDWLRGHHEDSRHLSSCGFEDYPPESLRAILDWQLLQ